MLHSKEFYEIMSFFEKIAKNEVRMGSQGLKKEDKENWERGHYYRDGVVNEAFKMFMQGAAFGKCFYRK